VGEVGSVASRRREGERAEGGEEGCSWRRVEAEEEREGERRLEGRGGVPLPAWEGEEGEAEVSSVGRAAVLMLTALREAERRGLVVVLAVRLGERGVGERDGDRGCGWLGRGWRGLKLSRLISAANSTWGEVGGGGR
jgi:hypothetical protein